MVLDFSWTGGDYAMYEVGATGIESGDVEEFAEELFCGVGVFSVVQLCQLS